MAVRSALRRFAPLAWCCLALAMIAGCRNLDNAQVDVLERELRQQENYIYELEDYLISYSEKLRQARLAQCETSTTTTKSKPRSSTSTGPLPEPTLDVDPAKRQPLPLNGRRKLPAAPAAASEAPPADAIEASPASEAPPAETPPAAAEPEAVNPEEMEAPALEIGPGVSHAAPLLIPDPVDYQDDAAPAAIAATPAEPTAAPDSEPALVAPKVAAPRLAAERLEIRRVFTESSDDENSSGSLLVVVEALNATDEPVDAIGAASIMIMVQDAPGSLKRIERWDFTAEETAAAWQSSNLGDGLHLELPLAKGKLPDGELELWARVVSDEGEKLLTPPDKAYRFEANQLVTMAEAEATILASSEAAPANPIETKPLPEPAASSAEETVAEATPAAQWRPSTARIESAQTAAASLSSSKGGWTSRPIDASSPRVATTPAAHPSGSGPPAWKRSATAQAAKEDAAWTPFR